jgi:hypothetical protein
MNRQIQILILSSFKDRAEAQLIFDNILTDKEDYRLSIDAVPTIPAGQTVNSFFRNLDLWSYDIIFLLFTDDFLEEELPYYEAKFGDLFAGDQPITPNSRQPFVIPVIVKPCPWHGTVGWVENWEVFPRQRQALSVFSPEQQTNILYDLRVYLRRLLERAAFHALEELKDDLPITAFISYSRQDGDFADLMSMQLNKHGIQTWLDMGNILVGDNWKLQIKDAIDHSDCLILILSQDSLKSEFVIFEWAYAMGRDKEIFPVVLQDISDLMHPILEDLQYKDFTDRVLRPWSIFFLAIKQQMMQRRGDIPG